MPNNSYIIATVKSWNVEKFSTQASKFPGNWYLFSEKNALNLQAVSEINPKYIFFPHWSWIVPQEIYENFECVCFHMTDVPYGRGGSPLQNLIVRGHSETRLTALKMSGEVDAGPVYMKKDLSLNGTANDVLKRASELIWKMIPEIVDKTPSPKEQVGDVVHFKRRKPQDGNLLQCKTADEFYNYIRMLDGEGYPPAFLETGPAILTFTKAELKDNEVIAEVKISIKE